MQALIKIWMQKSLDLRRLGIAAVSEDLLDDGMQLLTWHESSIAQPSY